MGKWGSRLFDNDLSNDIWDTYYTALKKGYDDEYAYLKTLEIKDELIVSSEEPLFWYSLAYTQWSLGRLTEEVKNKALKFIKEEIYELDISAQYDIQSFRKRDLLSLQTIIESAQCKKTTIRADKKFVTNPWEIGDIYAYRLHSHIAKEAGLCGSHILFQKIGNVDYYDNKVFSVVRILNKVYVDIPIAQSILETHYLPLVLAPSISGIKIEDYVPSLSFYTKAAMIYNNAKDYPNKYFTFVCNKEMTKFQYKGNEITSFLLSKNDMEEWIVPFYVSWNC